MLNLREEVLKFYRMEIHFNNKEEWKNWLEENNGTSDGLWMKIYKKHTGIESIPYAEAVEEALCYGWIDGKIKRINEDYYVRWYTPRRRGSRWSKYNIERAEKLIREKRMKSEGLAAFREVREKPHLAYETGSAVDLEVPSDLLAELNRNKKALENFLKFPPSARRLYIGWMNYAKRDKTRRERIIKIVSFSEQNKKPGML